MPSHSSDGASRLVPRLFTNGSFKPTRTSWASSFTARYGPGGPSPLLFSDHIHSLKTADNNVITPSHALPQVNKKNSSDFDGVYVYQDLEVPQTAQVKALEELLKGGPSLGAVGGGGGQ